MKPLVVCMVMMSSLGVYAAEEREIYRSWQDPVNIRELTVQTIGMVVLMFCLIVWRRWARRSR